MTTGDSTLATLLNLCLFNLRLYIGLSDGGSNLGIPFCKVKGQQVFLIFILLFLEMYVVLNTITGGRGRFILHY